jgi:hypothetical protein
VLFLIRSVLRMRSGIRQRTALRVRLPSFDSGSSMMGRSPFQVLGNSIADGLEQANPRVMRYEDVRIFGDKAFETKSPG